MTLHSQTPRTSSLMRPSQRRFIPIALVTALGMGAAVYLYIGKTDATPTAEKVSANTVPPSPVAVAPPAAPKVAPATDTRPVAIVAATAAPMATVPAMILAVPAVPVAVPAPAPAPAPVTATPVAAAVATPRAAIASTLPTALAMIAGDPVGARLALTRLVDSGTLTGTDYASALGALQEINAKLVFSPTVAPGDATMRTYTVASGDSLSKIAKRNDVQTDWRFIQRINLLKSEKSLRVGQALKIPVGAFHAEISKSNYLMRIYAGEGPSRVIVATYIVGLGELNSTPTGAFMVRPKSKLINPEWRNPRTGEHFQPDDPKNPIGERWIGLIGVDLDNQGFTGYGIHGTVEPDSIGKQASMGCVRMRDSEVAAVYELLTEPNSTVVIAP